MYWTNRGTEAGKTAGNLFTWTMAIFSVNRAVRTTQQMPEGHRMDAGIRIVVAWHVFVIVGLIAFFSCVFTFGWNLLAFDAIGHELRGWVTWRWFVFVTLVTGVPAMVVMIFCQMVLWHLLMALHDPVLADRPTNGFDIAIWTVLGTSWLWASIPYHVIPFG